MDTSEVNKSMSSEKDKPDDGASENDSGSIATVAPTKTRPATRRLPPFKVLLHNDAENDMLHVVETIMELTPLSAEEAIERMLEAHQTGVALILVTHKERAELYVDQFTTFSLTTSLEPGS